MFQIKGKGTDMPTKGITDSKLGRNFTIKNITESAKKHWNIVVNLYKPLLKFTEVDICTVVIVRGYPYSQKRHTDKFRLNGHRYALFSQMVRENIIYNIY